MQQEVAKLWHKDHDLQGCDFILLPGGFSYGDYLRSGAISRFSPIMQEVTQHAERCGYVMDICSGFQILIEAGLLTKNSSATTYTSSQFPPICCLRSRWV